MENYIYRNTDSTRNYNSFNLVECANNKYGLECNSSCGKCFNGDTCNNVNGSCPNGCDAGMFGDKCDKGTCHIIGFKSISLISINVFNSSKRY